MGHCEGFADCPVVEADDGCERGEYKGCIKVSNWTSNDVVDVNPAIHFMEGNAPAPKKLDVEKIHSSDPDRDEPEEKDKKKKDKKK